MVAETELPYLQRCLELAEEAVEAGDMPFGSILVNAEGEIVFEDRNRVGSGDMTRHPEFEIARWAANHMPAEERPHATVYTSGEHCPMCSSAHGLVGLGRIVYISSGAQLYQWLQDMGAEQLPIHLLPIEQIVPHITVEGPIPELDEQVHALHRRCHMANES